MGPGGSMSWSFRIDRVAVREAVALLQSNGSPGGAPLR